MHKSSCEAKSKEKKDAEKKRVRITDDGTGNRVPGSRDLPVSDEIWDISRIFYV